MASKPDNSGEIQVFSSLDEKPPALQTMISPPSRAITRHLDDDSSLNGAFAQASHAVEVELDVKTKSSPESTPSSRGSSANKALRDARSGLRRASRVIAESEIGAATVLFEAPEDDESTSPSGVPQIAPNPVSVSLPASHEADDNPLDDDDLELLVESMDEPAEEDPAALLSEETTTSKDKALVLEAEGASGQQESQAVFFGDTSLAPPAMAEGSPQDEPERQPEPAEGAGSEEPDVEAQDEAVSSEPLVEPSASSSSAGGQTRKSASVLGRRVGNIEIVSRVGKGNMGTVYKAVHRTLKTPYAVKVLHRKYSANVNAAERFRREALVCSQLRHPNVVFVTDFGYQKGLGIYIIMEFLDGPTLSPIIRQGPMDAERVCRLAAQLCDALSAAHRLDITHRDLKPENITVLRDHGQEEFVKVLDFGIASMKARHAASITTQGMVLGTPAYMSPEQIQGLKDEVGPCTDIYALGCIIYEMLTAKLPFFADSPIELCKLHLMETAPLISVLRPELKETILERLVARMLEKRIDRRPASMWEVQKLLKAAIRELEFGGDGAMLSGDAFTSASSFARSADAASADDEPVNAERLALIQQVWNVAPNAVFSRLIKDHPTLLEASDEDFFLALWAPLMRDLLDQRVDSLEMNASVKVLNLLMGMLMDSEHINHEQRNRTMRCVGEVISLAEQKRQEVFVQSLQDLTNHPNFPVFVLPSWAIAFGSGTWRPDNHEPDEGHDWGSAQATNEVQLIEPSSRDDELPDLFGISTIERKAMLHDKHAASFIDPSDLVEVEVDEPSHPPLRKSEKTSGSLIAKLRRPVTVESIKNVLSHDLFGVGEPE